MSEPPEQAIAKTAEMIAREMVDLLEAFDDMAFAGTTLSIVFSTLLLHYPDDLVEKAYVTHIDQCRRLRAFLLEMRAKGKH